MPSRSPGSSYSIAAFGAASVAAQVLLLRTLLSRFGDNELLIGIGLCAWLVVTGSAALLAGRLAVQVKNLHGWIFGLSLATPAGALFGWLLAERGGPDWLGLPAGFSASPLLATLTSFIAVSGAALSLGALFSLYVSAQRRRFGESLRHVSLWEALGSALGGIVLATWLLDIAGSDAVWVSLVMTCALLAWLALPENRSHRQMVILLSVTGIILVAALLLPDRYGSPVRNLPLIARAENRFGTLGAVQDGEQVTIYRGHRPAVQCGEWQSAEELAVLAAGQNPNSSHALVLQGSAQAAKGLLQLPELSVQYVQPDPLFVEWEARYCGQEQNSAGRFIVMEDDPRRVLISENLKEQDLLIVPGGEPGSILASRLMTREFFSLAHTALCRESREHRAGILLVGLSEPANYISAPEADLLASVEMAATSEFETCSILPLRRYWLICSDGKLTTDAETIASNVRRAGIIPKQMNAAWLDDALSASRLDMLHQAMENVRQREVTANTDLSPSAPGYSMALYGARFEPGLLSVLRWLQTHLDFLLAGALLLWSLLSLWGARRADAGLLCGLWIGALGAGGILTEVVLMNVYQMAYGQLHYRLGVLVAAYMAGLGLGAHLGESRATRSTDPAASIRWLALMAAGMILLLWWVLPLLSANWPEWVATTSLFAVLLITATIAGAGFQLAASLMANEASKQVGFWAGFARFLDHAAAAVAVLLVGVVFIPMIGCEKTLQYVGVLLGVTALGWWLRSRR